MAIDDIKFGRCPKPPKEKKPGKFFFSIHVILSEGFNTVFLPQLYESRESN